MSALSCAGICSVLVSAAVPRPPVTSEPSFPEGSAPQASLSHHYRNYATEAGTLPQHITRVRLIHRVYWGSRGFDGEGQRDDPGLKVRVQASALALDHGLTSRLSVGVGVPYVYENSASFSGAGFAASRSFQDYYARFEKLFIEKLVAQGECLDAVICRTRISRGDGLPVNVDFRVPSTNEKVTIPAQVSIRSALTSLVTRGAEQSSGAVGLGDLELGMRYGISRLSPSHPLQTAVGFSILAPTGKFRDVTNAQRAPGRGLWELHANVAADVRLGECAVASFSGEVFAAPGSVAKRLSLARDSRRLATGRCDEVGQGNNWDGLCRRVSTSARFERAGLGWRGLAGMGADLEPFGLSLFSATGSLRFERDLAERLSGEETPAKWTVATAAGLGFDGLKHGLPLQIDLEILHPVLGGNAVVAPSMLNSTFKVFF